MANIAILGATNKIITISIYKMNMNYDNIQPSFQQ